MSRSPAERRHYAVFHGDPDPSGRRGVEDRPRLVVLGNCQAESLRLLLAHDDVDAVRVPPVHELDAEDVERLRRLLARTDLLVAQPVRADYRGLPLGTEQLAAHLPASARVALVPPVRYAGLHPWSVVAHPPGLPDPDPPLVAYHDVRVLAAARRGWTDPAALAALLAVEPPDGAVRTVGSWSVAQVRRREEEHGTVRASDLLEPPHRGTVRTLNHPGNAVLAPLAARVRTALGLAARPPAVTRPLLAGVVAPLEPAVVAAWGLPDAPGTDWVVGAGVDDPGRRVPAADVVAAHLAFYARRPDVVALLRTRTAALEALLGVA